VATSCAVYGRTLRRSLTPGGCSPAVFCATDISILLEKMASQYRHQPISAEFPKLQKQSSQDHGNAFNETQMNGLKGGKSCDRDQWKWSDFVSGQF
jgi:hypothetical protein